MINRPNYESDFALIATCGKARAGFLQTPHGIIATPVFMPVASQGSLKTLTTREAKDLGATILLTNTYHLYLRPGTSILETSGGIHQFMGWDGPILTDSGGFQVFSLSKFAKVTDEGIQFRSHIDGTEHFLSPERAIALQEIIGADIIMSLDHCVDPMTSSIDVSIAMERTHRWARRCLDAHSNPLQRLFAIVQGGLDHSLRQESAHFMVSLDFPGYAIGGLALGEAKTLMYELTAATTETLPNKRPRYLMGVGSPEDLIQSVNNGVDLFDCSLPTRVARRGAVYTPLGRVNITASRFRGTQGPIDEQCDCFTCRTTSVAYLHHLFRAGEFLAMRLATIHNLRFYFKLMDSMRESIIDGTFSRFRKDFLLHYSTTNEEARQAQKLQRIHKNYIT